MPPAMKSGKGLRGLHERMVALVRTVAYLGLEARGVEVQCQVAAGLPKFLVVGLPDKAVGEARERVQAALAAMGLALPPKRITINLSPADLPKEGSHYDLPIALALLAAMGVTDAEQLTEYIAVASWPWTPALCPRPACCSRRSSRVARRPD
jgi:magnesium chelatase family protein